MANFPSLSINPEYPLIEDSEDSTLRSDFEGGYEITRPRFTRVRKIFRIKYLMLPDADKSSLETFMGTVKNGADSFTWTHPKTATQYTVRFVKLPVYEYVSYGYWDTSFELRVV